MTKNEDAPQPRGFAVTRFTCINPTEGKRDDAATLKGIEREIRRTAKPKKVDLPWIKLARFGDVLSLKGCIRHDDNVEASTGCEIDYDGDKHPVGTRIPLVVAVSRLKRAGLEAHVYTTPSDEPKETHWRALCPFSKEYVPAERARFVARLNGLFDGTLDRASFGISQSFYYGNVNGRPPVRVVITEGQRVDLAEELDAGGIYEIDKPPDTSAGGEPSEPIWWMTNDLLREAVNTLDPNMLRPEWLRVGLAIHYQTGGSEEGLEIFDTWSRLGTEYKEGEPVEIWRRAKNTCNRPVTAWTILKMARRVSP